MRLILISLALLSGCACRPVVPVNVCLAALDNDRLTRTEYSQIMLACTWRY